GRDLDIRLSKISVSKFSVSPIFTGLGKTVSVNPKLPKVVSAVRSSTVTPTSKDSVNKLFTTLSLQKVVFAYSSSRCKGCELCVRVVNNKLSVSVTVLVRRWGYKFPIFNSS